MAGSSRFGSLAREAQRRIKRSPIAAGADAINAIALLYQVGASGLLAWDKAVKVEPGAWTVGLLAAAVGYSTLHKLVLKDRFKPKKWSIEEQRRAEAIGVAVSRLADGVRRNRMNEADLDRVERGLLEAMQSEVEAVVVDTEGIYLNVNLLIERRDGAALFCLNRADLHRDVHGSYPKDTMIAWRAMEAGRAKYEPDFRGDGTRPYRSILAMPITMGDRSIGAISIDSANLDHFRGAEGKIAQRLLPYVVLMKLALVYRAHYDAWPDGA